MSTPIIEILTGEHKGEKAYVTYDDGECLRVTPVDGDPLLSVELTYVDVRWFHKTIAALYECLVIRRLSE